MPSIERVTVTLPSDLVSEIDRLEKNRSRFVLVAVEHELERRRREQLMASLDNPHPDSMKLADSGLDDWAERVPPEDVEGLVDPSSGVRVRWDPEHGWRRTDE
jgi:hypothetical protein